MNVGNISTNNNLKFYKYYTKADNNTNFPQNAPTGENCVTLDLSKEGRERLKNELVNNMPFSLENLQKQKHYLNNIAMDSSGKFEAGINKLWNNDICTEQDWVNSCINTYNALYNEIVSGYADGTREKYVFDENSEDGFRKLTMAEELQRLDDEYNSQCDFLEGFFNKYREDHEAVLRWASLVDKVKKDQNHSMYQSVVRGYEEFKSKQIPGGVRNALVNGVAFLRNPSINVVI